LHYLDAVVTVLLKTTIFSKYSARHWNLCKYFAKNCCRYVSLFYRQLLNLKLVFEMLSFVDVAFTRYYNCYYHRHHFFIKNCLSLSTLLVTNFLMYF